MELKSFKRNECQGWSKINYLEIRIKFFLPIDAMFKFFVDKLAVTIIDNIYWDESPSDE